MDWFRYKLCEETLMGREEPADRERLANRLEFFREKQPSDSPRLLVAEDVELPAQEHPFIPECKAWRLTNRKLKTAMREHGALIVRGLFRPTALEGMNNVIDQVLTVSGNARKKRGHAPDHLFNPPDNLAEILPRGDAELSALRMFSSASGSALTVEAPAVAEMLLKFYERNRIKKLVTSYLGEPPCLSAKKWVIRRSPQPHPEAEWHQDGAFMGTSINTINLWIPLTRCGGDTGAPGMDIIPARLNSIVGAVDSSFDWSVSDSTAKSSFGNAQPVSPIFNVGDAFFFDHFNLHRTQRGADFSRVRYAIETWFFGSTTFPKSQIPIAW